MDEKELLKKMEEFQKLQKNLQLIVFQRQTLEQQIIEIEDALEEIKTTDGRTFKIIGEIFIEKDKNLLIEELKSKKELLELKIKSLVKQEEPLKKQLIKIQKELEEISKTMSNINIQQNTQ